MGFFTEETEFEKECRNLIKVIKGFNNIDSEERNYFINYVNELKIKARNNDFYDFDFLASVILECLNSDSSNKVNDFDEKIRLTKFLLPLGEYTENYDVIKSMIMNNNFFMDKRLYTLFDNRLDYMQIVNIINSNEIFYKNYNSIVNYALEVSPFCNNQVILKNEILSFINGLTNECGSIEDYVNRKLGDAKKRCGVYPIDEKTLSLIENEARKAQSLIRKLELMKEIIETYNDTVKEITRNGALKLNNQATLKVEEMQKNINDYEKRVKEKLDNYLLSLEQDLKSSSDQIFNQILKDTQDKLNDIKLIATGLSTTTTRELLRIQKSSQESVDALKNYVDNEPMLQQILKDAADSAQVKEALIRLGETKNVCMASPSGIVIPGNDRLVIPANPNVILPHSEIKEGILPAFDENIPFDVRYKKILEEKKRREDNGEIFHSMVEEVINCVMEGDWVYLWGPSGCGKSYIIKQVASLVGIDYVENGKITDKYSIMAYNDPHGRFRATQAFIAILYGKLLSLDEFDNGNTDTQVVLNELYSGLLDTMEHPEKKRYITFAEDMTVAINPNFRMISAGNTSGEGENQVFSSRGKIDESVQERMTPKRFDYDNKVEQRIFGDYNNWYQLFINFRKACDAYAKKSGLSSAPGMITTRDAAAITKYIRHNSKSVDQVLREKFIQVKKEDYLRTIIDTMRNIYGIEQVSKVEINSNISLGEVEEKVLAKKLIYDCDSIVKNRR